MINIDKFPVVIFAGARTGSSALGEYISKKYNLVYFNEPDMRPSTWMVDFVNYNQASNRYVVKLMGDRIFGNHYSHEIVNKMLSDSCYKIKILRKNKIEQIASFYIARARDKWVYTTYDSNDYTALCDISVVISNEDIKFAIKYLDGQQKILDNITTDVSLYYEDLQTLDTSYNKTPQPINYNELLNAIADYKT